MVNSKERREDILINLKLSKGPFKGSFLAKRYGVTRQVIVKDIAILRASGVNIIATADGYRILEKDNYIRDIIVSRHTSEMIEEEMKSIIKFGGIIEDVTVSHPLYGEIKGMIMVRTLNDLEKFIEKSKKEGIVPLSYLTDGIHMHTIAADSVETINLIKDELISKGFLV